MAACGLVEMCYLIESMNAGLVGPLANLTDPIGNGINMPTTVETVDAKYAIKNSFGFGGKSAAIVLERP
jgi:3-oxoacyl-(acyl-carrier-protein) synthase